VSNIRCAVMCRHGASDGLLCSQAKEEYPMSMKKVFSILFILLLIIVTAKCRGGGSSGTGTATVFWNPVTTYTNNLPLTPAGYTIHYGTAPGHYTTNTNIPLDQLTNSNSPSYTIHGLPRGTTYYFAVSAYDSSNVTSGLSREVSKTIN
jgi:hypothetical protein